MNVQSHLYDYINKYTFEWFFWMGWLCVSYNIIQFHACSYDKNWKMPQVHLTFFLSCIFGAAYNASLNLKGKKLNFTADTDQMRHTTNCLRLCPFVRLKATIKRAKHGVFVWMLSKTTKISQNNVKNRLKCIVHVPFLFLYETCLVWKLSEKAIVLTIEPMKSTS